MPIVSSGQITITDLSDAPVLSAFITANASVSQIYNPSTAVYQPSYPQSPIELTLNLTRAGRTDSLVGEIEGVVSWSKTSGSESVVVNSRVTSSPMYVKGGKTEVLVNKVNIPTENGSVRFTASGNWRDSVTNLLVPFAATIDLTVTQLGQSATVANFHTAGGAIFVNEHPNTLTVNADLYEGGSLSGTNKSIKFFISDSSIVSSSTSGYDSDGGIGWKLCSSRNTPGYTPNVDPTGRTVAQGILTVSHSAVTNFQTIKCIITKLSDNSKYTGMVTIIDYTDPITVEIESVAGNIFKNSQGTTSLKARIFQSGSEIDVDGRDRSITYKWTKRDRNGVLDVNFGGSNNQYKTGKTINVNASEIDSKATYTCEVHK